MTKSEFKTESNFSKQIRTVMYSDLLIFYMCHSPIHTPGVLNSFVMRAGPNIDGILSGRALHAIKCNIRY